ncbi:MAG: ABC transporter substrate-binding protein [Aphanothece sp. CMT-3BRIN-NPC111]|nr:ABC transporter substrate-binding protein [Aphanothece sp. CMT-3BRIN-NPC111]
MDWFRLRVRQRRLIGQFLGLFCLCLFLVISCGRQQNSSGPAGSSSSSAGAGRVTIGTTLKPRTMDPADAYEIASINAIYNISDRLYTYEPGTAQLKPQLATALPKVSADGLTYTIPVRTGVVFHDGTPFNAEAMAFSLRRFIENKGKPSFLLADTVESVKAKGDRELTIKLKKPFAAFPSLLAFPGTCAVSPKAYEIGAGKFKPNQFVGTGPYKLIQFSTDSLQLDVFDKYWGEKPLNKGVNIQVVTSAANLFNQFRTGAVDVTHLALDPDQIRSLKEGASSSGWQAIEAQGSAVTYMSLNRRQKPLDNPVVRQAIAAMINRQQLNERVLLGQAQPLYSMVPTTFDVSKPVFKDQYGDANIEKAKQLLQQAGFSPTNPLKLQIWYPTSSVARTSAATTLKAAADQQLGGTLQFELNSVEGASFFKNVPQGIYPTTLHDWYPDFLDPDNYVQPFMECPKGSPEKGCDDGGSQTQGSFYYNDRVNQLISQERKEQNPQARKAIFAELQDILAKDVPYIPLWQSKDYVFAQKGISGAGIDPTQTVPFWRIKKAA